ncbi:MAG TPA: class I SAM-dependent methyltransferase [Aridibacter sp.]|nr:class I SAM-dependent methyltransferase [Aridibacter sp.]
MESTECILCRRAAFVFEADRGKVYFRCTGCSAVFLSPDCFPGREEEKYRYLQHNNDVTDPRYQRFVAPIVEEVRRSFSPEHRGLDFGCGEGPVIKHMLGKEGYSIELYDPFFAPDSEPLSRTYDYVICCEVIEHFFDPRTEFRRLDRLVNPVGKLVCMTELLRDGIEFSDWHYKNDSTHVFFLHTNTLGHILANTDFSDVEVEGRLIVFSK